MVGQVARDAEAKLSSHSPFLDAEVMRIKESESERREFPTITSSGEQDLGS